MAETHERCRYEELAHTAEVGVRLCAATVAALYACAAHAMFSLFRASPDREADAVSRQVTVHSADAESLMVDWLAELVYLHETTGLTLAGCEVDAWSPTRLDATVTLVACEEPPSLQVKAVTYHQLSVRQTEAGWVAEVYFDI